MVGAPTCRSVVRFHLHRFKAWAIFFTPLCLCLLEETVKAVGLFYQGSMPGEVKEISRREMEKSCDGLNNSREGHSEINPQCNILEGLC